uniref:Restriction endonuclease S subunits n=1 Tax=Uncultured archaeon GZfos26G2 TaxID=3386331 RepID=Q64AS2_UNCAG|nr:restriction endonuclease S subunits [uncultured archaeon GZfos29E12]
MKLKPYPKYKDSEIEWIGEIPEGWEVNKIKNTSYVKGRIGWHGLTSEEYSDEGAYLVTGTDFKDGVIEWEDCHHVGWDRYKEDPYIHLKEDDLLITKDGTIGKVALIKFLPNKATLNSGIFLVRPLNKKYFPKFMYWMLNSTVFERFFDYIKTGATISHLYQETFERFFFPIPLKQEQVAIASFLDKKTAKIDALIEKDKRLIELLKEKRTALIDHAVTKGLDPNVKMKDFGIVWIGKIPEDAKIMPFRRVCYVNQGLQFPEDKRLSEPDEKSKIYITIKYIHADEDGVKEYIPNPPRGVICKKEDVLLARTGATGEVITNQEGVFHNNFFKVNYNSKIDRDYLVYYLKMDSIKKVLLLKAGVTTIPDLNHDAFLSTPFILYSIEKQKQIAEYLDKKTAKIDKNIKLIEKKIKLLEEYKKSLINHVVTGKVDVRKSEV